MAPGLREALALMTTGQRMRLWIPEKLAFAGAAGKPKGPLMVDVMLLDIIAPPPTPPDVAAPPADAQKTKSGLASKVLKPGTGTVRPKSSSTVTVHYTRLDPRRTDVRQLGDQGPAGDVPARRRDQGLDRGRAADGRR